VPELKKPDDPLVQIRLSDLLALQRAAAGNAAAPAEPAAPSAPPHEILTTREAAALLGVTPKGLEQMRAEGRGPKFFRVGRAIRYRRSDLVVLRDPSTE
jgi:hypothetical protein